MRRRAKSATETHVLHDGAWVQVASPRMPERANFVIVCDYGDWSGVRALAECLAQVPGSGVERRRGFYSIEER